MHRLRLALAALTLFAVSCGGSDTEQLLTDLGLSEEEAECLTREYEERDLDVDRLLRVDEQTDLTDEEQAGLLEVARICSNIGTDTDAGDDTGSGDGDTVAGDTGDDTSTDTDTDPADDPDDGGDDDSSEADDPDDPDDTEELSPLEQAFVDTLVAEGLNTAAAMCFLTELDAAGFSIFDLAALGLDETSEPPAGVIAAFLRCGDELADAGITDIEGFFGDGSGGDPDDTEPFTYGDDAEFDALWDSCESGDWDACDQLFWLTPIDSEYETFGSTCGLTSEPLSGGCAAAYDDEPVGDGGSYGDDPVLDALYDACADGDFVACDDLFWDSPIDSDYEAFAATCGGARSGFNGGSCADLADEPYTYGDDPDLDADWDSCAAGNNTACDDLYLWSPIDSEYETFGSTCGGRSEQEWFGGCKAEFG